MSAELTEEKGDPAVELPTTAIGASIQDDGNGSCPENGSSSADQALTERLEARRKRGTLALRKREWTALGVLLLFVLLFGINFKLARVVGSSMFPTFRDGQLLLVWRTAGLFGSYKVGDVIVFRAPDGRGELIKRIAFIQKPDGSARMPEKLWTLHGMIPVPALLWGTHHYAFPGYMKGIEEGRAGLEVKKTIFVMGDNTWESEDSRIFGPIDPHTILGRVIRHALKPAKGK